MTASELKGLLERVETATGPDRDLDEAIMGLAYARGSRHIGAQEDCGPNGSWVRVESPVWIDPTTDKWVSTHASEFTASIDAAVDLVAKVLPGWHVSICAPVGVAWIQHPAGARVGYGEAEACTPPLALLAAMLEALLAQGDGKDA